MAQASIDVSFIIIDYHSVDDVIKCVNSLSKNCNDLKYEVIVSSNSQYDDQKQNLLVKSHPEIIWSFNKRNGGFAYGMNRGIAIAHGKYIVTQNPDTRILNNKLINVIYLMRSNPDIGIVGPQILNKAGQIQDTCRPFLTPTIIVKRYIKRRFLKNKAILEKDFQYNHQQNVDWIIGAFMIISRQSLDIVGGFNEKYFMYVEDMDLCFKLWNINRKVIYYPELQVEYEGDRKSISSKFKYIPININKYTIMHIRNYSNFLFTNWRDLISVNGKN